MHDWAERDGIVCRGCGGPISLEDYRRLGLCIDCEVEHVVALWGPSGGLSSGECRTPSLSNPPSSSGSLIASSESLGAGASRFTEAGWAGAGCQTYLAAFMGACLLLRSSVRRLVG